MPCISCPCAFSAYQLLLGNLFCDRRSTSSLIPLIGPSTRRQQPSRPPQQVKPHLRLPLKNALSRSSNLPVFHLGGQATWTPWTSCQANRQVVSRQCRVFWRSSRRGNSRCHVHVSEQGLLGGRLLLLSLQPIQHIVAEVHISSIAIISVTLRQPGQ
jgi:hypothetical protein